MEVQFDLLLEQNESLLTNLGKRWAYSRSCLLTLGVIAGLVACSAVATWMLLWFKGHGISISFYQILLCFLLGSIIVRPLWKLFCVKASATVGNDQLQLLFPKSGEVMTFPYLNLNAQYHIQRDEVSLLLEYPDGRKLALVTSLKTRQFSQLAAALERALYRYRYGHDRPPPVFLAPPFLRGRYATGLLVTGAIAMVALTLFLPDTNDDTRLVVLCVGYGALMLYTITWLAAHTSEPPPR